MSGSEKLLELLAAWGREAVATYGADGAFAFGSLVYLDGEQLTSSSDIDLVIIVPKTLEGPVARTEWLEAFYPHKESLESDLLKVLQRNVIEEPFSSVVPVTQLEIDRDLHKQNLPEFYSANQFLDLVADIRTDGLAGARTMPCDRFVAGSLSMTQSMRHRFLGVAANTRRLLLEPYSGGDPIPKPIMRAAAMARRLAVSAAENGSEYDLRRGLDYVTQYLLANESSSERLHNLNKIVSERRGGRGHGGPLTEADQLLLAEIVYELATREDDTTTTPPGGSGGALSKNNRAAKKPILATPQAGTKRPERPSSSASSEQIEGKKDTLKAISDPSSAKPPAFKPQSTLAFFSDRLRQAFPGVRETAWFDDPDDILDRLGRLLKDPIKFADASPIWWWRGGNFQIEEFKQVGSGVAIMNHDELKVRRAAAVPGQTYKWDFVYVETDAMEPTGLYDYAEYPLEERLRDRSYITEEYGLFKGEHAITRDEYDDGGTYIDNSYVDTIGQTELRVRYVTPYNFVIAPQGSPINNAAFDKDLVAILDSALNGNPAETIEKLKREVARLPLKREF